MGLDTVELVMTVEETYGIAIEDADAEKILTVGLLHQYVLAKVALRPAVICPGAVAFYRFRRAAIERWGADRRAVRPSDRVENLMPAGDRRAIWADLGGAMGLDLPRLEHPGWFGLAILGIFFGSATLLLTGLAVLSAGMVAVAILLFLGLLAMILLGESFRAEIPPACPTVGDLSRLVGSRNFAPMLDPERLSREVWDSLVALISELFGIPPDMLEPDTHFVHDLGAD